jgi:hypothetical protein
VPEHSQAPTARQICTRLGVSWQPLLAALFEPGRDVVKFVSHKQRATADQPLSGEQAAAALRMIATRLGVPTLRPAQYDMACQEILAADRRRHRHGIALRLPTANQIERAAGTWDQALALAGLQTRGPAAGTGAHRSIVSYHEAVQRFLESQGAMPTFNELQLFARTQGFPLPRTPTGGHKPALLRVQAEFRSEGRWAPATFPPKHQRPAYDFTGVDVRQPGEQRRVWSRTKDECIAGVIAYLDELTAGERVTQKRYGAWAVGKPHPAPSAFHRHGGWTLLLAEARAQRRDARSL